MNGTDIKQLRRDALIPQGKLAEKAGISQWLLSRIETGHRALDQETEAKIVSAFHALQSERALVGVGGTS